MSGRGAETRAASRELHVGVDIGGTFTDLIGVDPANDVVRTVKVPSTPSKPADGVMSGLESLLDATGYDPAEVTTFSHGSTVTVNALIQREGAKTGVILTDGFDAIPVAGTGARPEAAVKNPRYEPPDPLVPQRRVSGVPERLDSDGTVLEPLDDAAVREAVAELKDQGVESIAVCLLFSFLDPTHEQRVAELIRSVHPDCWTSRSSRVSPRIREYPRLATTLVDAYIGPLLEGYLDELAALLDRRGFDPDELTMMLSHGGLAEFDDATRSPVASILSGPTAGVQGALVAAAHQGVEDVITMDMGGTSCDIAIAPGGDPLTTTQKTVSGHPVAVPMVDIQAIGAGGGTIARVEGGRLTVGPESAGADPGPICYGRGGQFVTVTDANAYLGRLNPDSILDGDLPIDLESVEAALRSHLAEPLDLAPVDAAAGVVEVVNDMMKKELSVALTEHGCDPRTFSLVAYGGAGPMHAAAIARELSLRQVIVPPWPGLNSAVGLLTTDRKWIHERSAVEPLVDAPLTRRFERLEADARAEVGAAAERFVREIELRYAGQSYELTVPVADDDTPSSLREAFTTVHREQFGHVSDEPLETMTYRVITTGPGTGVDGDTLAASDGGTPHEHEPDRERTREVYLAGEFRQTPVFDRVTLQAGTRFEGPAIVEQLDTTTVVEPGVTATVDGFGNLVLRGQEVGTHD